MNTKEEKNIQQLYLSRIKNGCILLSHENLLDPNFTVSIVLVCVYKKEGVFGLVLNRPSHMPLQEVFAIDSPTLIEQRPIYIGGPVNQESFHIIQLTDKGVNNSFQIYPGVFLGGEWDSLESILLQNAKTTRIFLGYAGWGTGQLEQEILQGAWEVYNINVEQFLYNWEEPLFTTLPEIRLYLKSNSIE